MLFVSRIDSSQLIVFVVDFKNKKASHTCVLHVRKLLFKHGIMRPYTSAARQMRDIILDYFLSIIKLLYAVFELFLLFQIILNYFKSFQIISKTLLVSSSEIIQL